MKILEVGRYKKEYSDHILPFILEQGESLRQAGCDALGEPITVDYFRVRGNYVLAVRELKKKIREFQPDIVHAHYGLSCITAELQSLVPVVSTFHNGEWHSAWVNFASSLMSLRAKHMIYVAPHIREKVFFKHKNYTILPCGVNMQESKPTNYTEARKALGFEDDKKYILFGGAFSNMRKNVALLCQAVEVLEKNRKNTLNDDTPQGGMDSACAQPCSSELDSTAPNQNPEAAASLSSSKEKTPLRSKNNIRYPELGVEIVEMKGMDRKTVSLYMSACDLFALPTKNEGSPQALKEAMACNCPIVATDCADIAYLLGNLEGHYLLSNKGKDKAVWSGEDSSVEELAGLVGKALSLPVGFRTKGRERIVELGYTNELVAQKLIGIYRDICER